MADLRTLQLQVANLERRLAALQKCVQAPSGGQSLTLKAPGSVTIEAGASMEIRSGLNMKLVGARIDLN